jgi:hypothetical protein
VLCRRAREAFAFALAFALAGSFAGSGCASALRPFAREHVEIQEYKPLSVPAKTAVTARWKHLQALADAQAWQAETVDEVRGLMIASRPTRESQEVREHVRVLLRSNRNEITVQTEVLEDGEWDVRDFTSGRYEYARESEIARWLEP